jgi:hypothetical protein
MAASGTVALAYLREMAVTLHSVWISKDRSEQSVEVHKSSSVNALRLWSMELSTYGSEENLRLLLNP